MPRPDPPPIIITPTATPSGCLADDYERARRDGEHVRIVEGGKPAGVCWCGVTHMARIGMYRTIFVSTSTNE